MFKIHVINSGPIGRVVLLTKFSCELMVLETQRINHLGVRNNITHQYNKYLRSKLDRLC